MSRQIEPALVLGEHGEPHDPELNPQCNMFPLKLHTICVLQNSHNIIKTHLLGCYLRCNSCLAVHWHDSQQP